MLRSAWKTPSAEEKVLDVLRQAKKPLSCRDLLVAILERYPGRTTRLFFVASGKKAGIHPSIMYKRLLLSMTEAGKIARPADGVRNYTLPSSLPGR